MNQKEIFQKTTQLSLDIQQLASIVQNEGVYPEINELREWADIADEKLKEFSDIIDEVRHWGLEHGYVKKGVI